MHRDAIWTFGSHSSSLARKVIGVKQGEKNGWRLEELFNCTSQSRYALLPARLPLVRGDGSESEVVLGTSFKPGIDLRYECWKCSSSNSPFCWRFDLTGPVHSYLKLLFSRLANWCYQISNTSLHCGNSENKRNTALTCENFMFLVYLIMYIHRKYKEQSLHKTIKIAHHFLLQIFFL